MLLRAMSMHATTLAAGARASRPQLYKLQPLPLLGAQVEGIDLHTENREDVIEAIIEDVHRHRLLLFRNQGVVSGERHVEVSQWFGELESTFYKHPRSPHPDVFRVSNDRSEGCTGVGRTGWHIDGSFQPAPFAYSLYHMVSIPRTGDTVFAPLTQIVESLPPEQRRRWERLSMCSDRRGRLLHPLIYSHPVTAKPTLCFHLGMTDAFVWDAGTPQERMTNHTETQQLLDEIDAKFKSECTHLIYHHKWEEGDFIIADNLALGHEAAPETQAPRSEVGLRVLHRTTIKGRVPPRKAYSIDEEGNVLAA